jgi:hypothetical protein
MKVCIWLGEAPPRTALSTSQGLPSGLIGRIPTRCAAKILAILYAKWKKMGFSKGTLHYMKKNADSGKPFTLNKHVRERLQNWNQS